MTDAFIKCINTRDNKARLTCYDKIGTDLAKANSPAAADKNGYEPTDLADLKVDIKDLIGKRLVVSAQIQTIGDFSFLKSDAMDMAPVFAMLEEQPRDDRKKLLNGCQVGEMLGISAQKIGRISNANNLKTDQYGIYVMDKSAYSSKQVEAFRYNANGVEALRHLIHGKSYDQNPTHLTVGFALFCGIPLLSCNELLWMGIGI